MKSIAVFVFLAIVGVNANAARLGTSCSSVSTAKQFECCASKYARGAKDAWCSKNYHQGLASSYCSNPKNVSMPSCATPNACDIKSLNPSFRKYFAGVPKNLLPGKCGECVKVSGKAGTVVAEVIDTYEDDRVVINLSEEALKVATGFSVDIKPVTYTFVKC